MQPHKPHTSVTTKRTLATVPADATTAHDSHATLQNRVTVTTSPAALIWRPALVACISCTPNHGEIAKESTMCVCVCVWCAVLATALMPEATGRSHHRHYRLQATQRTASACMQHLHGVLLSSRNWYSCLSKLLSVAALNDGRAMTKLPA